MLKKFQNINILIINEHYILRKTIKDMLKALGYNNISLASSGEEALELINNCQKANTRIQFILSGDTLSGISGFDLIYQLKNSPEYFKIPAVLINDETSAIHKDIESSYGIDFSLQSPFKVSELDQMMDFVIMRYEEPSEEDKLYFEAQQQYLSGNYQKAVTLFMALAKKHNTPIIIYKIAQCLKNIGSHDNYKKIMLSQINSKFVPSLREIYEIQKEEGNEDSQTIDIIKMLIESEWEKKRKEPLYLRLFSIYINNKALNKAYDTLKEAVSIFPKSMEINKNIQELETKFPFLSQETKSETIINKGTKYINDKRIIYRKMKNSRKLEKEIEELESKLGFAEKSEWLFDLSVAYLENGNGKKAKELALKAITIAPSEYNTVEIKKYLSEIS